MEIDWNITHSTNESEILYFRNPKSEKLYKYVGLHIFNYKNATNFNTVIADKFSNCLLYYNVRNKDDFEVFQKLLLSYKTTFIIKGYQIFDIYPNLPHQNFNYSDLDLKYYSYDTNNHKKRLKFEISYLIECFPEYEINNPIHIAATFIRLYITGKRLKPPITNLVNSVKNAEFALKSLYVKRWKHEKKWRKESSEIRFQNLPLAEQNEWGSEFEFEDLNKYNNNIDRNVFYIE